MLRRRKVVTKEPNNSIYYSTTDRSVNIQPYKMRRLYFANDRSFWGIWTTGAFEDKTRLQLIYKLATAMSLSRFTQVEMTNMLFGWHRKHEHAINYAAISSVIEAVSAFTLEFRRRRNRIDTAKHRIRRKLACALDPAKKESDRALKSEQNRRYREKQKLRKSEPEVSK